MSARAQAIAARDAEIDASASRALAARAEKATRPMTAMESMSLRLGVSESELTAALTSTVFKGCNSKAEFLALVVVANEYRLNPLTKEIYAFPNKGGGVVPMVSVDGWITLMNTHPAFDGIEFEYHNDEKGDTIAVESIIYRKDRSRPIKTIEYMEECKRNTDPWRMSPRRMLRHRALIQGVRIAFGFSGIYAQGDEDDGILTGEYTVATDSSGTTVLPSMDQLGKTEVPQEPEEEAKPAAKAKRSKPAPVEEEAHDPETGEVLPTDPQTGMTQVDEDTARQLDEQGSDWTGEEPEAEAEAEEPEAEEAGSEPEATDAEPLWRVACSNVMELISKSVDRKTWTAAEAEFLKVAGGLPDDVRDDLDRRLYAKRDALQKQQEA